MRTAWFHLTARVFSRRLALCEAETGAWLFERMRGAFPGAIAVVLMPDHPHLIVPTNEPRACERRLRRLLGQFGRAFGIEGLVSRVPPAEPIPADDKLWRRVRYVLLNPCRKRLTPCPLAWPWSTHRDVVGAIVDPWVSAERLASAVDEVPDDFAARHHAYVSGDPHVRVEGTPPPVAATSVQMSAFPLRTIAEAAGAALRRPIAEVRRRGPMRALFCALAWDQGWCQPVRLAEICDVQPRAIHELVASVSETWLQPARLCLGDDRLRTAHWLRKAESTAFRKT